MSVGDQLGLDDNSELLDQARQKWPAWVAADPRLGVVDNFDDLRSWLPTVDHETSDQVLLALAMLAFCAHLALAGAASERRAARREREKVLAGTTVGAAGAGGSGLAPADETPDRPATAPSRRWGVIGLQLTCGERGQIGQALVDRREVGAGRFH